MEDGRAVLRLVLKTDRAGDPTERRDEMKRFLRWPLFVFVVAGLVVALTTAPAGLVLGAASVLALSFI
jgi:hypothetical protein